MSGGLPEPRLSVVLPTYDEAENAVAAVRAVRAALADVPHEVIVVDDDSPDGTWRLVEREAASSPGVRVIRRIGRRGLTGALSEGLAAARGTAVAWLDCDLSAPPELLPDLLAKLDQGWDLAVASRYVAGGRDGRDAEPLRRWTSRAIVELARALLYRDLRDYTSGYCAARRGALEGLPLRGSHGEYFIELMAEARRRGARIVEVPYELRPRRAGESKTERGFALKGLRYVATVLRLWLRKTRDRARGRPYSALQTP